MTGDPRISATAADVAEALRTAREEVLREPGEVRETMAEGVMIAALAVANRLYRWVSPAARDYFLTLAGYDAESVRLLEERAREEEAR